MKDLVLLNFENPKVSEYLQIVLRGLGDPEQNFKDKFFVPLLESLEFSVLSEAHLAHGKVDYAYVVNDFGVGFEVKPPRLNFKKGARDVTYRGDTLSQYFSQVEDYLSDPKLHYVILTDGFSWYFFSKASAKSARKPYFLRLSGESLFREKARRRIEDLRKNKIIDTLKRWENESEQESLDDLFFDSIKRWAEAMKEDCPKEDMAKIITLINRFVFVRTLEDIGALPLYYLREEMNSEFSKWKTEEKQAKKFLGNLKEFIYDLYDTELFSGDLPIISPHTLEAIIAGKPSKDSAFSICLYDFNFAEMNFDVLGHVYERYLAELRKERGIFYTKRFVVDYILANTLGSRINQIISEAKKPLEKSELCREDFEASREAIMALFDLRILDPACGSGGFLVRAFEMLMQGFEEWERFYREKANKHPEAFGNLLGRTIENSAPVSPDLKDWRQKLLLSCIHGVDLDKRACEVAKMNLWLTLIKSEPERYWWESIRSRDLGYVLPDLSLNIIQGNSLISLEIQETERILSEEFSEDMERIRNLRKMYVSNYRLQRGAIDEIRDIKANIRSELMARLRTRIERGLTEKDALCETDRGREIDNAVFWPLEFPFKFKYVVGNPPYIGEEDHKEIFRPVAACPLMAPYYMGKMDYWYFFVHLGLQLCEEGGELSMITSSYWRGAAGAEKLRQDIMEKADILDLVDFMKFKVFKESAPGVNNNIFRLRVPRQGAQTRVIEVRAYDLSEEDMIKVLSGEHIEGAKSWITKPVFSATTISFHTLEVEKTLEKIEEANLRLADVVDLISEGLIESPAKVTRKALAKILGKEQPTDKEIENLERQMGFKIGDGVFVISEREKETLLLNPDEEKLLKPYYDGFDFRRFMPPGKNKSWIIYIDRRLAKTLRENPNKMPNITRHLDRFREIITSNNKPYGLHCPRNETLFTSTRKIIALGLGKYPVFVHIESPCYVGFDCYSILLRNDAPISPVSFSAILNSSIAWFWFYCRGKRRGGDNLQIVIKNIKSFPVAIPERETDERLSELAMEIGRLKAAQEHLLALWKKGSDNLPGPRITLAEFLRDRIILTRTKTLPNETQIKGLKPGLDEKENAVLIGSGTYAFGDRAMAIYTLYTLTYVLAHTRKKTWDALCRETVVGTEGIQKLVEEIEAEAKSIEVPANIARIKELIREKSKEIDQLVSQLYGIEPPDGFRIWEIEDEI